MRNTIIGVLAFALVGTVGAMAWTACAMDEPGQSEEMAADKAADAAAGECCEKGDTTPPLELIAKTPKGGLHNPYNDDVEAMAEIGKKRYLAYGCNGCHGGNGGGGMCPPITNDAWVYGADDDVVFRLIAQGTDALKKEGYKRVRKEVVVGPMPPFGEIIKTSDELWRVIAFLRVKNPSSMKRVNKPVQ